MNRRNQIANESDAEPTPMDSRWPIDEAMVEESIDSIELIADAIYKVVSEKSAK